MIVHSSCFDNLSIDSRFDTNLKYEKNNFLTSETKNRIEEEICEKVRKSIYKSVKEGYGH